jgi:DNA-binding transcriptional ArsR family regulator
LIEMATETELTLDQRLIKAVGHPLRQRLLHALNEGGMASPSQLAEQLEERLPNVSYHMKILEKYGAVELVETSPVRGALEHFYRATARPFIDDQHWARLPVSTRRALFDHVLQQIWEHVVEAADRGGLDDPDTHVSWTTLELDEAAYKELTAHLAATLERAMELQAEAAVRLAALPAEERESHRTELAVMHFHRAPGADSRSEPAKGALAPKSTRLVRPTSAG